MDDRPFWIYQDIAKKMYGGKPMPAAVARALDGAARLCKACGGGLVSRQAIASIIVSWDKDFILGSVHEANS